MPRTQQRRRRKPGLQPDALAVKITGSANSRALVDVDVRVAKHSFDKNRDGCESQRSLLQVGHVDAGKKLGDVEFSLAALALAAPVIGVDVNIQINVARLHAPVDERLASIIEPTGHVEVQSHVIVH